MPPLGNAVTEEAQGKSLVDEAIANGVEYFVYSSVDRGGDAKSWDTPTDIPHFVSKHHIELHLREKAGDKMMWSILRPTVFMDVSD
jgi:NmrA-like family protein